MKKLMTEESDIGDQDMGSMGMDLVQFQVMDIFQ